MRNRIPSPQHMEIETLSKLIDKLPADGPLTKELEAALQVGVGYGTAAYVSQRAHWQGWLANYNAPGAYNRKNITIRSARMVYQRINCAPMLCWLAEASGFEREVLRAAFDEVLGAGDHGSSQAAAFRRVVTWEPLAVKLVGFEMLEPASDSEVAPDEIVEAVQLEEPVSLVVPRRVRPNRPKLAPLPAKAATQAPKTANTDWREEFHRLEGAYSASTIRGYFADLDAFEKWCTWMEVSAFPSDVETICQFIEDQGKDKAPSTVKRRLYAIRKAHRLLGLDDPTYHEDIDLSIRRVKRASGVRPRQAKGMTKEHLEAFIAVQDDFPMGWRNAAMLSLGYDLLARRSELIALRDKDVTWLEDGTLRVLIRLSKSDPFGQGRVAYTSKRSAELLRRWVDYKGSEIQYLFCPVYHNRPVDRGVGTDVVKQLVKAAASLAGYPDDEVRRFTGHSMRVGAAQDLLKAGNDMASIMRAGGWKSVSVVARYLEMAEHNVWQ
ncbi:MAG: tyrosine-type recombinase/integrase [Pseudomonadota bacterium]